MGAVPEAGFGGGEGRICASVAAVAVVWASWTLLGDRGWGSGRRPLVPNSERPGRDLGFTGAVFGLGVPRPFPRDEGDTLISPSPGGVTPCPTPFLSSPDYRSDVLRALYNRG